MENIDHIIDSHSELPDTSTPHVDAAPEASEAPLAPMDVESSASEPSDNANENSVDNSNVDEYGNEIGEEEKLYSKKDVERMMQERLKRVKQEPSQEQTQQVHDNPYEPNVSDEDWQKPLEEFVYHTLDKREQERQQREQERIAREEQQRFEHAFSSDMANYNDFETVIAPVADVISAPMMEGIKHLEKPAAFLYSAAKTHSEELQRISQMQSPVQQIAAMGALETKMRQNRTNNSKAPRPLGTERGDVVGDTKHNSRLNNVDYILTQEDKKRLNQFRS